MCKNEGSHHLLIVLLCLASNQISTRREWTCSHDLTLSVLDWLQGSNAQTDLKLTNGVFETPGTLMRTS